MRVKYKNSDNDPSGLGASKQKTSFSSANERPPLWLFFRAA
jgi:hypothetical protein